MRNIRFHFILTIIYLILINNVAGKERIKKKKDHTRNSKIRQKHQIKHTRHKNANETKRQFITRPRIRYFGNRPYIWMKPAPLTQRTIVTTHIPRPPLALPYSSRIMNILASKYPSLYNNRQMITRQYAYPGEAQETMFNPAFHLNGEVNPLVEDLDGKIKMKKCA